MVEKDKILRAIEILKNSSQPLKIFLFGSYARGEATESSDIDIMIVKSSVKDRVTEMVELGRLLSPLRLPIEILVVDEDTFKEWCTTPGNIYFEVNCEGQLLYDSTAA